MSEAKKYTAEVLRAMEAQGLTPKPEEPPALPEGQVSYLIVIGDTNLRGQAPISTVAAMLRQLAGEIEPS